MSEETSYEALLGEAGPFARRQAGFRSRPQQIALARAVAEALASRVDLIAEAGTGVGKTYAYLTPIVRSPRKAIISTGTKTLQDQLFHRDLPAVLAALGIKRKVALLKGRANYVCRYRTRRTLQEAQRRGHQYSRVLADLYAWSEQDSIGELAEVPFAWPQHLGNEITSTADNCLGSECADFQDCFVMRARQRAMAADLVVVNHHLLFADLGLKREGFGELLPQCDAVVVDEAHKAPDIATEFFGISFSTRMMRDLARDALTESAETPGALGIVREPCAELDMAVKKVRLMFGQGAHRAAWRDDIVERVDLGAITAALNDLVDALDGLAAAAPGLENCWLRAVECVNRLELFSRHHDDHVAWYQTTSSGFSLHLTPLEIADAMRAAREAIGATWIFTSATLGPAGDLSLLVRRFGLDDPTELTVDSPFDYARQSRLYVPQLPPPASDRHIDALIDTVAPLLDANVGRAFLLFTSHRNLRRAALRLRNIDRWALFVQGEAPRGRLLEGFLAHDNAVLLGAASFWEGVDVVGEKLSLVVIDKLPFSSPADPIVESRIAQLREAGKDAFMVEQLPHAILTLKQGAGRLIRSETDYGVLVIGDVRVLQRGYGKRFIESLPAMPLEQNHDAVVAFINEMANRRR